MIGASALHFAFELSDFYRPLAIVAAVNESTFEHLKIFFWPAAIMAVVEHAFIKGHVNNYWWGKADDRYDYRAGEWVTTTEVTLSFSCTLTISWLIVSDITGSRPALGSS